MSKHKPIPAQRPPPQGRQAVSAVLTESQRRFAAENHDLIYAFLRERRYDPDEFYDIAAFGFLRAVIRYLTKPELKGYSFSTIAWPAMHQSIANYCRAEERRRESEQKYAENTSKAHDDSHADLDYILLLHDLAAVSSEKQYEFASLRLQGYSIAEIARSQGMAPRRISRMIKELFQVYLKLYQ